MKIMFVIKIIAHIVGLITCVLLKNWIALMWCIVASLGLLGEIVESIINQSNES